MTGRALAATWSAAASLAEPALRLMLAWRARGGREITARLAERRGKEAGRRADAPLIWLHAASVGETISILPVLAALAAAAPRVTLLLTTGTVTSARVAAERLPPGALHRFVPLDVPRWISRFLEHWRPDIACFVESEIWPNTLDAAAARHIPLVLLNARLSSKSFRRWQRVPGFARHLLSRFQVVWARSDADAARLGALGARDVAAPGDLKFAAIPLPADPATLACLQTGLAGRRVFVAASLHPGEDAVILAADALLRPTHPDLLTILVPRHPGRGDAIARMTPMPRRSRHQDPTGPLYLADTLGELGLFYRLADCAFIGGSLVPHGGQNPLEAIRLGVPVATGPHTGNFTDAFAALAEADALTRVTSAATLANWVARTLAAPAEAAWRTEAARLATERWSDLPDRAARMLLSLLRP